MRSGVCPICSGLLSSGDHTTCGRALRNDPATAAEHVRWFARTGHCGQCGSPGNYCVCTTPCGCAAQHQVGSGLAADALDQFADIPVSADQGELFDA